MWCSGDLRKNAPRRVQQFAWLVLLVAALACGGGPADQSSGSGVDSAPVFATDAQAGSGQPAAADDSGVEAANLIVNPAVRDEPHPIEPSEAADPGGGLATAPGAPDVPSQESTRTWATTPGIDPSSPTDPAEIVTPVPEEAPDPRPSEADLGDLTRGNGEFAFDLYGELSATDGNLFFSPHRISTALAMTYAGARGDTETAMADTLRFSLQPERLHAAFAALGLDLDTRSAGKEKAGFRLNSANAVWAQQGHPFRDAYLNVVKVNYGGEVSLADFSGDPDGSRSEINRWVEQRTEEKIEDLIPAGLIDGLTRMVLVNAVYFKAGWLLPFGEHLTSRESFHLLDGGTTGVDMMRVTEYFRYAAGDGYQVVDLPYVGRELSMAVLLPDQGRFREIEAQMDGGFLDQALAQVAESYVALEMPRFEFDAAFQLGETLKAMGMSAAFDPSAADFSGMDGLSCARGDDGCLYIGDVVHKAFVSVDEAGTEAAAATGVMMQTESAKPRPVAVRVDGPFIFLIRDHTTGTILFVGRVTEP